MALDEATKEDCPLHILPTFTSKIVYKGEQDKGKSVEITWK